MGGSSVRGSEKSRPGSCEEYIAGCDKNVGCVETLVDHARSMAEVLRGPFRSLAYYVEREYLHLAKTLELEGYSTGITKLVEDPRGASLMEILVVFHDLGKCTPSSQRSLREKCTAPYHEATSAALLLAYLSFLGARTLLEALPLVLAVLLHHHAMRGLGHVREQVHQIRLGPEDLESALRGLRCVCEILRVPRVEEFSLWVRAEGLGKFIRALGNLLEAVESSAGRVGTLGGDLEASLARVYRSSILLTAALSAADNVAATLNRRLCGEVGVWEALKTGALYGFVRYLLAREIVREGAVKAFRRVLGVT